MTSPPDDSPGSSPRDWGWTFLKLTTLATFSLMAIGTWILALGGDKPDTRQGRLGLYVLPLFGVFYLFQFRKLKPTFWSVVSHFGLIASLLLLLGSIWMNRYHQDEFFDNPLYLWGGVVGGILLLAVSVGGIAHAAGFRGARNGGRKKAER